MNALDLFSVLAEASVLSLALSLDAFVASFAYGSGKIKIPFSSALVLDLICTAILTLSLLAGTVVRQWIPPDLTIGICFSILMLLGLCKLLDSGIKAFIRRHSSLKKEIRFNLSSISFVLKLYADPEKADIDQSKVISPKEAASLAVALSLDGLAVGFGAAFGSLNLWAAMLCSLIANALAVLLGSRLGNRAAAKLPVDFSWVSGVLLIFLAFAKLQ